MVRVIADLQIHSKYARAVSSKMDLFHIVEWSEKKGINLTATGDWTHPLWFKEIQKNLEEVAPGIFAFKKSVLKDKNLIYGFKARFVLSTEISSIYKQGDKLRRIHTLIFVPSVQSAERINTDLINRGCNLFSDGRPIVGLTVQQISEIVLEIEPKALIIPAHIWTPHFSLFGSRSGFDSVAEAFGQFEKYIYAIETGLSSDPIMNWQVKDLDNRRILSFSDAHSGPKLGREATVFYAEDLKSFDYFDLYKAIKGQKSNLRLGFTIEFFPEEGKYHLSGHRACQVSLEPEEVRKQNGICPKCGKPLIIGVKDRVRDLSARVFKEEDLEFRANANGVVFVRDKQGKRVPFVSLVPLLEILEEIESSKTKAFAKYNQLLENFADEFSILLDKPISEIEKFAGPLLAKGINNLRQRKVSLISGYDGVFGKIKVLDYIEKPDEVETQSKLF
ncbi:MAG: helicase UvrD [Patescibacteria group bacterium]|nr:MAG: helicase UvrD [Patescibacteria group bacterium]